MPVSEKVCVWPNCGYPHNLELFIGPAGFFFACMSHRDRVTANLKGDLLPVYEREAPALADALKHPFIVHCEDNPDCYYHVSAKTYVEGVSLLTHHNCPHMGGPTREGLMMSRTKLEDGWLKLDACVASLMEDQMVEDEKTRMKGVSRGMAEVLALFMTPHFISGDEVVKEAMARYKAKKEGVEHETPGLSGIKFQAPPKSKAPSAPRSAPVSHNVPEKQQESIKLMAANGFPHAQLAKTYGVSIKVIEQIVG